VLGLVNRYAQQLNVFNLAMSLKATATVWVLWAQTFVLAQTLADELLGRPSLVRDTLRRLLAA
jgi:type III secretion protein T